MGDALHIGFDQPDIGGVLPVPDRPFDRAPTAAPARPSPTDADLSHVPEARTTSRGPEAWPESGGLSGLLSQHSGPQEAPTGGGGDVIGATADVAGGAAAGGERPAPPAPAVAPGPREAPGAPDAAGLPTRAPPAAQRPLTADEQWEEMRNPTTAEGKQQAAEWDNVAAAAHAAWERDLQFSGLQNATSDAIANIVEGAKAKLGVTLEDPTHGGYMDEAVQRVVAERKAQSWGGYFNPINPEGFFGGGFAFKAAVQQAQMQIFDEKRQALAEKIKGDQAYDRAGENADALALLDPDTPASMLGAKLSHQANVSEESAGAAVENPVGRMVGSLLGGLAGGTRDPVNDALLMFGAGLDPVLAKTYFPLAPKALRIASDATEAGVRQALLNMGLTTLAAPWHQAANEQRGEDHGLVPFLKDLEAAGITGFIPGALIHGVKALDLLHGENAKPWIDEFIREVKRQSQSENVDQFLKEAGAAPRDPTQAEPGPPEFPPDIATNHDAREEILLKSRSFMDAVHTFERMKGLEKGSTYANVGRNRGRTAPPPPPPPPGGEPPPEPPRGGGDGDQGGGGPALLEGPRRLLEGPKDFPKSPPLSDNARNQPTATSVTASDIRRAEADYGSLPPRMPGVPPSEHLRTFIEALRHGEAPDVMAPPEPPMIAPPAADTNFLPPDHLPELATAPGGHREGEEGLNHVPHMPAGKEFEHNGKPVTRGIEFRARELRTDAKTYQYKAGGDAKGVTDRLSTVKKWSPVSAGALVVHERLDGHRYVADGHQRTGLANRIMDQDPSQDISIPGYLYKEADGWTPQDVRAEAAMKNIREGIGDTMDIARVLRDSPDLWDDSLPVGRGDMKEARGLANLSDEAWGMVVNEKVRRDFASFVGNMAQDQSTHLAIMDNLVKYAPRTQNEARMIIADTMQAGFNKEQQLDIFGPTEVTTSLLGERAKVYAAAEKLLQDDKKIFSMLNDEAPRIIEAGNVLADTNAERADRAGRLAQGLIKLAERAGPISSALNRAAQRVADGEKPKTAARDFLNELPALLRGEGIKVADVTAPPKYNLDEPKAREEQVRDLDAEFMATQPTMFGEPAKTVEQQVSAIQRDVRQKLLDAGLPEAQADADAALWASRYATRAARLGRSDPEQMYRESGMVVRGDAQREASIAGETGGRTLEQAATVPTFYSAVERAVTNAKQAKATPDQWLAMLKNMPGVKPEEMKWLGLEDWLKGQKGSITRDAIADYVRANSIQVNEVTHSNEVGAPEGIVAEMAGRWIDEANGDREAAEGLYLAAAEDRGIAVDPNMITAIRNPPANPTRYESYRLPGGENYRELLLTLPQKPLRGRFSVKIDDGEYRVWDGQNDEFHPGAPRYERLDGAEAAARWANGDEAPEPYKSSHWDEPNILAHIRFDDRMVDGKRALHMAEVQSDWHQQGRKSGYKMSEAEIADIRRRRDEARDRMVNAEFMSDEREAARAELSRLMDEADTAMRRSSGVPDAPFKTTWNELAIKRMIRHAAENGYDMLTWDTGEISAERYDLSKHISMVLLHDNDSGGIGRPRMEGPFVRGRLSAFDHNSREIINKHIGGPEELADAIGKEAAEKLLAVEPAQSSYAGIGVRERMLKGLDLKVGGEGMAGFYDKILPATVSKLTKKFGGKVTEAPIGVPQTLDLYAGPEPTADEFEKVHELSYKSGNTRISPITGKEMMLPIERVSNSWGLDDIARAMREGMSFTEAMSRYGDSAIAEIFGGEHENMHIARSTPVHALEITPQLRDAAVNEGFPLFQPSAKGEENPRGSITIRDNGAVIDLFTKANASTFPHESAHLWLKELGEDAAHPDAPAQIKDDFKTVLEWLGAENAESITDKQHEKWARGFEQYLREGRAPSSALARVFAQFKEWLKSIYRSLIGLGKEIPDSIRGVMDRMLASDEEIAAQRAAEETGTERTKPAAAQTPETTKSTPPAAAPTLEEAQEQWKIADYGVQIAADVAWREAETAGARKQAKAIFRKGFEAALTGEPMPPGKWAGAGYTAGKSFAGRRAGKDVIKEIAKAREIESAYEASKPPAVTAVDDAIEAAKASPDPLDQKIGEVVEQEIKPLLEEPAAPAAPKSLEEWNVAAAGSGDHSGFLRAHAAEIRDAIKVARESAGTKRKAGAFIDGIEAALQRAEEAATPPAPPALPPQSALNHAEDLAGRVVYHSGDLALIRGFSSLNGQPVFVGAKGDMRARLDIESDKTNLFTPQERADLVAAKRAAVAADAEAHVANPDGPFAGGKTFAASPSVPEPLAAFTEALLKKVGIKARVYLTTVEDAHAATDLHGPFAAIGSAGLDQSTFGTTRRLPNGDHYIAIGKVPSDQVGVETVSHEVGHIVEKEHWKDAPPEVKAAVMKDYEAWRDEQRKPGVKARDLIRSTRPPETAESIRLPSEDLAASDMNRVNGYWTAFDEWFADQTARWATSSAKPMTLVERFFAAVAAALRKIHAALGDAFKPVKSMKDWLDSLSPSEIVRDEAPAARAGTETDALVGAAFPGASPAERAQMANLHPDYLRAVAEHNAAQAAYFPIRDAFRGGKVSEKDFLAARRIYDEATKKFDKADALRNTPAPAAEAGPEGTLQSLMPGVAPVRDAERMRLMAGKPLRGGNRELPEGGLFDEGARAQTDLMDMFPTGDGLKSRSEMEARVASRSGGEGTGAQESGSSAGPGGAPRDFEEYVRDMAARGDIDPDDADAIIEKFRDDMKQRSPSRARTEGEKAAEFAKIEKARRDMLGAKAKTQLLRDVESYRTPHGAHDMVEAMYSLWEGFGHSGYAGVKQLHEAYLGLLHAKMADVLNAYPRTVVSGARRELVSMKELRKASFGEKADPKARALYQATADALEWSRQKFNELGGAIPKRQDYGLPQSHNEAAVSRAFKGKTPDEARKNWVRYINPMLNWEKMYDPMTGELFQADLPQDRKEAILGHVWNTIVTGGEINNRPALALKGRGSIATQRTDHRFLVFKDAESASKYNREFGDGDEFTQIMHHLHSLAADMAIMHRFGPNPAGMIEYTKQLLNQEAARAQVGQPHRLRRVTQHNASIKTDRANDIIDGFFQQYRGDRPARNALAIAGTIARNWATGSLLGSSVIPHLASNWMIQSFARYAGGIPSAKVLPELVRAFGHTSHEEMLRAGLDVENGLFNVGSGARQLGKWQKIANWSRWFPDRVTHWFGLTPLVEANKGAFYRGMMATMADLQKTNWRDLPDRIRSKMQGYGLRERDWRVMQASPLHTPAIGSAKWLRPIEVMDAGGPNDAARHEQILQAYGRTSLDPANDAKEAARIAEDVGLKMLAYMQGEREVAVPANSMRARARIYGSSDAGTFWGQFRRSFGLFKGFIGSFMVSQIHTIVSEMARGRWRGAAYTAAIFTGMTLGGMLSLQLKQGKAGKDFLPMNPLTKSGQVTWLRAMLTGGSFGIFGDFLASQRSSFGVGPLETLAGPVAEWPLSAMEGTIDTVKNLFAGKTREPLTTTVANAALKFTRANTPFMSTGWATQAAWNRILDHVQMSYDRNAYHKQRLQEEHLRNDTGQHFTWRPGQWAPDRFPRLTPSR